MYPEIQPLLDFIDALKSEGASDEFVVSLLRQNGWSEKRIYQAFGAWYEARTGKAVPNGGGRVEAARDAFLYLLAFIALGIWTVQLGALLFTAIDRAYPNAALDFGNDAAVLRSMADELAGIIVGFPLFLLVTRAIVRGIRRQPERLESAVRKWLTYTALVITASIIIGDAVTFLAYFLRGDLETRFVLKVVTLLVLAGGVFAYYLESLRRNNVSAKHNRWFALAAFAAVLSGVFAGFVQLGSPAAQRIASQDARRLFDLSSISQSLHARWMTEARTGFVLPATLADFQATAPAPASASDPVSGQLYRYTPLQGNAYQLCAAFARPSPPDVPIQWRHAAGEVCFHLDASQPGAMVPRRW
jgi:hypothetical protein